MQKRYIVKLDQEERKVLSQLVNADKLSAKKRSHAQILLLADSGRRGPGSEKGSGPIRRNGNGAIHLVGGNRQGGMACYRSEMSQPCHCVGRLRSTSTLLDKKKVSGTVSEEPFLNNRGRI